MSFDAYREWLGVPDGPRPPDHYRLLGLAPGEDDTERIEAAYRRRYAKVSEYRFSRHVDAMNRLLVELSQACDCLKDPRRREEYDRTFAGGATVEETTEAKETLHCPPAPLATAVALPPVPRPVSIAAKGDAARREFCRFVEREGRLPPDRRSDWPRAISRWLGEESLAMLLAGERAPALEDDVVLKAALAGRLLETLNSLADEPGRFRRRLELLELGRFALPVGAARVDAWRRLYESLERARAKHVTQRGPLYRLLGVDADADSLGERIARAATAIYADDAALATREGCLREGGRIARFIRRLGYVEFAPPGAERRLADYFYFRLWRPQRQPDSGRWPIWSTAAAVATILAALGVALAMRHPADANAVAEKPRPSISPREAMVGAARSTPSPDATLETPAPTENSGAIEPTAEPAVAVAASDKEPAGNKATVAEQTVAEQTPPVSPRAESPIPFPAPKSSPDPIAPAPSEPPVVPASPETWFAAAPLEPVEPADASGSARYYRLVDGVGDQTSLRVHGLEAIQLGAVSRELVDARLELREVSGQEIRVVLRDGSGELDGEHELGAYLLSGSHLLCCVDDPPGQNPAVRDAQRTLQWLVVELLDTEGDRLFVATTRPLSGQVAMTGGRGRLRLGAASLAPCAKGVHVASGELRTARSKYDLGPQFAGARAAAVWRLPRLCGDYNLADASLTAVLQRDALMFRLDTTPGDALTQALAAAEAQVEQLRARQKHLEELRVAAKANDAAGYAALAELAGELEMAPPRPPQQTVPVPFFGAVPNANAAAERRRYLAERSTILTAAYRRENYDLPREINRARREIQEAEAALAKCRADIRVLSVAAYREIDVGEARVRIPLALP